MDIGRVIKIMDNNKIIIAIESKGDCDSCQNKFGCNVFSKGEHTIEIKTEKKFQIGDMVKIEYLSKYKILISIVIFLIPLIILFLFYQLSMIFFKNELISVLIGFSGLFCYFIIIILIYRLKNKSKYLTPSIAKIDEKAV